MYIVAQGATAQKIVSIALPTGGIVIAQDAELSDLSLDYLKDYLKALSGMASASWVVIRKKS